MHDVQRRHRALGRAAPRADRSDRSPRPRRTGRPARRARAATRRWPSRPAPVGRPAATPPEPQGRQNPARRRASRRGRPRPDRQPAARRPARCRRRPAAGRGSTVGQGVRYACDDFLRGDRPPSNDVDCSGSVGRHQSGWRSIGLCTCENAAGGGTAYLRGARLGRMQ